MKAPPEMAAALHDGPPVEPRPAASVLVLDEHARPWTVLMMRRPGGADFAPGAYVFPGGSQHGEDQAFEDPLRAAAVRELFEEAGILLARQRSGAFAGAPECERLRAALSNGRSFPEALLEDGLEPAFDGLTMLSRWVTPERLRRRFDARFYVALLPAGQELQPQPGEVEELIWIDPVRALGPEGPTLVYATRRVLESVAGQPNPAGLIAGLRSRQEPPPVTPVIEPLPDGSGFQISEP